MRNKCSCSHINNNTPYQEWPTKGTLKKNMNLPLRELKKRINDINTDETEIFMYVMTSVKMKDGEFKQEGSGPNFEGDIITLCTCMYKNRAGGNIEKWKNRWVAGFTSITLNLNEEKNSYMFYLMKVKDAYSSQKKIWDSFSSQERIRNKKNSRYNKLGDIYQPKPNLKDEYKPQDYYKPISVHSHMFDIFDEEKNKNIPWWHYDIDKSYWKNNKRPSMLVGNPEYSFLWSKPLILKDESLNYTRTKTAKSMREFLSYINNG